jgi:hypothetical protein
MNTTFGRGGWPAATAASAIATPSTVPESRPNFIITLLCGKGPSRVGRSEKI